MTPGSLGVNAATFAGTKTAGMLGGVFAVLGVLSPTLTLTLLAAAFFQKFRTSKVMSYIMKIVKPVCIGMVLGVLVGLCRQTCITEQAASACRASPSASSALCCSRSSSSVCRRSSASRRCWGWCASGCFDQLFPSALRLSLWESWRIAPERARPLTKRQSALR